MKPKKPPTVRKNPKPTMGRKKPAGMADGGMVKKGGKGGKSC